MPQYNVANQTLTGIGSKVKVSYIPFWQGGLTSTATTTPGSAFLMAGSSTTSSSDGKIKLHTLDAWSSTATFSLECFMYAASNETVYAALWDFTTGAIVPGTQILVPSQTPTTIRSAPVSLIPGHTYGVTFWASASTYNVYMANSNLVVFPQ